MDPEAWADSCRGRRAAAAGLAASSGSRLGDLGVEGGLRAARPCCRGVLAALGAFSAGQGVPATASMSTCECVAGLTLSADSPCACGMQAMGL